MAIAQMRVPTIFSAIDKYSSVVDKMIRKNNTFGQSASAAAMRTSTKFNQAGTSLLTTGAIMAGGIGLAVNEAIKFEKAVTSLAAVTGTKVGVMNGEIESLSKETKRSVIDIAKSFEIVGSKMSQYLDNPVALKSITKASILMADAAGMELEPAIESLTGVLNIFGKSAKDALYIVNKLSAGEIVGSISIAETSDLLRQFGGTARLANVQVDESVALIQTLTKSLGVEGVGRGIRNLMTDLNMVGAFDKNKTKALTKAGVDMDILGNKSLDLVTRLTELKKLEGNSAAMGLFFKKTGIQTGATLFQNFGDYIRFLEAIKKTNQAQEQADKNNATMAKRIKDLKANISLMAIKIGSQLLPRINSFIETIMPMVDGVTTWISKNEGLASTLLAVTAGMLALGAIAKIGAVLFYGISKAIQFYTFVTKIASAVSVIYEGVMLTMALTGSSLTVVLWSMATALWAILWPIGAIVLAVVELTWIIADMSQHWEDWNDVILLLLGPLGGTILLIKKIAQHWDSMISAFSNGGILEGIKSIGYTLEDYVLGTLIKILNIAGRLPKMLGGGYFKELSSDLSNVYSQSSKGVNTPESVNNLSTFGGTAPSWGNYTEQKPKNLAGKGSNASNSADGKTKVGGEVTFNFNDPGGLLKGVDTSKVFGINVNTTSTKTGK